jgi:Domain of unknown function (DUF4440)
MQRVRTWIAVCVLVGLAAVPAIARAGQEFKNGQAPPQGELTPEEQELVQLERAWDAAFVAKDIRFIERVLADEFVATYGDGTRGDKAAELAQTLDFDQQVNSSVLDSFRVRIYGDTALVCHLPLRGRVREAGRPVAVRVQPEHQGDPGRIESLTGGASAPPDPAISLPASSEEPA